MFTSSKYRQNVVEFQNRLNKIIAMPQKKERIHIDTTGNKSRAVSFKSHEDRLAYYGQRRFESVARMLSIFEIAREAEKLGSVELEETGAIWQAFRGTTESNACHTCPTHLKLNGQYPTLITKNRGLQRHIIIEFADCVLMPRAINEIDIVMDETIGKSAFLEASKVVINERGTRWQEGLDLFREAVRDFLGPARDILLDTTAHHFKASDSVDDTRIEMICAYYQGMFLTSLNTNSIDILANQVKLEMGSDSGTNGVIA